eukprot:432648-Amphidinium_carterae.2
MSRMSTDTTASDNRPSSVNLYTINEETAAIETGAKPTPLSLERRYWPLRSAAKQRVKFNLYTTVRHDMANLAQTAES